MRKPFKWMTIDEWKTKAATDKRTVKGAALQKTFDDLQMKAVDGVERAIKFVISSQDVDRDKDTLAVTGWKLDSFKRNPVVPFAHDYSSLPVARALDVIAEKNTLVSTAVFASKEVYPFADTVYQMLIGGFLNAVSVGFRPLKHEMNKDRGGVDFLEQELLEYSVVPVPANPEALVEARSMGIDLGPLQEWAEEVLDEVHGQDMVSVPKGMVEQLSQALSPTMVFVDEDMVKTAAELAEEKSNEIDETEEIEDESLTTELSGALDEAKATDELVNALADISGTTITTATTGSTTNSMTLNLVDPNGEPINKEIEQKVDPSVLSNPLPESYEWITAQLINDAMGFLTRNGVEARTDGMDMIIPISTFNDSFVFCLMGRDRPFEADPCYQGSYKANKRLGGIPQFRGEPSKVDVQVSVNLVQQAGVTVADFKQAYVAPEKAMVPVIEKQAEPAVLDFLASDTEDLRECLSEVLSTAMKSEVQGRVKAAINKMRGRVD